MVVTCEKCDTRYRLDESRLAASGSKVRCSRCKHSFVVKGPPAASGVDAVEEVAQQAASRAMAESPDVTQDLLGFGDDGNASFSGPEPEPAEASAGPPSPSEHDDDIEWQFNEEPAPPPGAEPTLERPGSGNANFDFGNLSGDDESLELERASDIRGGQPRLPDALRSDSAPTLEDAPAAEERPSPELAPSSAENSLDEIGNPESWNLLSDDPDGAAAPDDLSAAGASSGFELPSASGGSAGSGDAGEKAKVAIGRIALSTRAEVSSQTASEDPVDATRHASPRPSLAVNAIGWLATVGLLALIVHGAAPRTPAASSGAVELAGLRVESVQGRFVENALGGILYVVSGRLRNGGPQTRAAGALIQVNLVDADGSPIKGARSLAAPRLPEQQLREAHPDDLRREIEARAVELAQMPLQPVDELEFEAVFESLPPDAARFTLEVVSAAP
ncbi:MAG: zinc-ribbon domain-containing protein [Deltaproteobacteria bacterium]|nr:MAG: zinc-ribbon domain-containing protein [Deltaproteobacteria bacterium]